MVFAFFKKSDPGMEHVERRVVTMIGDARHSFDMATGLLLSGGVSSAIADDIRATDERINDAEQTLRSELVVHVSVSGGEDIGQVMGYTLLLKKIERIGDQAKNILDLSEEGISFAGADDADEIAEMRRTVSKLYGEVAELLASPDAAAIEQCWVKVDALRHGCETKVREYFHSSEPGHVVVPRAIFYRYMKRIVANLGGVLTTATEPIGHQDYRDGGQVDIDDD